MWSSRCRVAYLGFIGTDEVILDETSWDLCRSRAMLKVRQGHQGEIYNNEIGLACPSLTYGHCLVSRIITRAGYLCV
jgi:hypothetical protein